MRNGSFLVIAFAAVLVARAAETPVPREKKAP
jgi:hypothetical protein